MNKSNTPIDKTSALIQQAASKGWDLSKALLANAPPPGSPHNDYIVCCELIRWLQSFDIYVIIAPLKNEWSYWVHSPHGSKPHSWGGYTTWDDANMKGIEEAIKLLPL